MLFRGAGIEENNVLTALLAGMEFLGTHGGHMVHHLHLLPKILAGHVHAPFRSIAKSGPVIDASVEHVHLAIAHALQGGCSERGSLSIIVTDDDRGALVRHQTPHPKFQLPARYQAGAGDMRAVVFTRFSYVNTGAGRLGIEQVLEICRGYRLCHAAHSSIVTSHIRTGSTATPAPQSCRASQ
jgi:hypothetical protein